MRLATIRTPNGTTAVRLEGDACVTLPYTDVGELLDAGPDWRVRASVDGDALPSAGVSFAPVVLRPRKIICLGLNYAGHVAELGLDVPAHPTLFAKFARALIGAHDPIWVPAVSAQLDWEAELAIVIGAPARHVRAMDALAHVAGWSVSNDVSVRDYQHRTSQFLSGKTFEGTTPLGPALVTPDESSPDGAGLHIACAVNGITMQDATTDEMIFRPADVIAYISEIVTLDPGDVILTGTPSGVGMSRRPPVWLADGDEVVVSIDGVGTLRNTCRAGTVAATMHDTETTPSQSPR